MRYKCVCLSVIIVLVLYVFLLIFRCLCLFFAHSLFALVYFRILHTIFAATRKRKDLNERHLRAELGTFCVRRAENGSGPCKCGQKVQAT